LDKSAKQTLEAGTTVEEPPLNFKGEAGTVSPIQRRKDPSIFMFEEAADLGLSPQTLTETVWPGLTAPPALGEENSATMYPGLIVAEDVNGAV